VCVCVCVCWGFSDFLRKLKAFRLLRNNRQFSLVLFPVFMSISFFKVQVLNVKKRIFEDELSFFVCCRGDQTSLNRI